MFRLSGLWSGLEGRNSVFWLLRCTLLLYVYVIAMFSLPACCEISRISVVDTPMNETARMILSISEWKKNSDTGNRTPGYLVRGDDVSHYTISEI